MEKVLKIIMAILLFLCLLDMPYGYYQLVRFMAMISFGFLAVKSYARKDEKFAFTYGILAILFQPIFKISLGRDIWNIIDVIVGSGLIIILLRRVPKKRN